LFGLLIFIFLIISGFLLIVPKDELIVMVRPLPVLGPHTETIINIKTNITDGGAYFIDDAMYFVTSTWLNIIDFSLTNHAQKIVIELDPVRTTKTTLNSHQPFTSKEIPLTKSPPHLVTVADNPLGVPRARPKNKTSITPASKTQKNNTGASEYKTGLTFYKGIGEASKNFKTAREWFLKAAAKANAAAQYNLGIMSYLGQGIDQNFSDAAKWFEQAAKQDNSLAQYNLGFMFYEGKGVAKDYLQAFMWIDRAARLGDKKAIQARPTIEKMLPKDLIQGK
jgi:hypothetical protein